MSADSLESKSRLCMFLFVKKGEVVTPPLVGLSVKVVESRP